MNIIIQFGQRLRGRCEFGFRNKKANRNRFETSTALHCDETHQQHDAPATRLCVHCKEHGHDEAKCFRPKYRACCRSTPRIARSFERQSTNARTKCEGAMDPKGHNETNCRETMDRICAICEECGSSKCQSGTNSQCPEHMRTKFMQRLPLSPKGRKLHITRRN
jgi:hypothetical protein